MQFLYNTFQTQMASQTVPWFFFSAIRVMFEIIRTTCSQAWYVYFKEGTKAIAPCPRVNALVPLKCSSRNLQFPHRVPFTNRKCLGALARSKRSIHEACNGLICNQPCQKHQAKPLLITIRVLGYFTLIIHHTRPTFTEIGRDND